MENQHENQNPEHMDAPAQDTSHTEAPVEMAPEATPAEAAAPQEGGMGAMVGAIVIVVLLVFGALFFWGAYIDEDDKMYGDDDKMMMDSGIPTEDEMEEVADTIRTQGSSPDISAIEADLSATDLGDLEAELENLDFEFNF